MLVRIHGFDWGVYAKRVMPAFTQWLIEGDESSIYQLYQQTRCAREERFTPHTMQGILTWPRAEAFIKQLPRGLHSHREYQKLCSAEQFTAINDVYVYRHPPQLYQNSDAVRVIWGALIEEYCLPWLSLPGIDNLDATLPKEQETDKAGEVVRSELVSLLHSAGFNELAQAVNELEPTTEKLLAPLVGSPPLQGPIPLVGSPPLRGPAQLDESIAIDDDEGISLEEEHLTPPGMIIGRHPATLRLRGWLAGVSVRAMALFELLACGRRRMPFGHNPGEPFESYIGYLTPDEVWHLALCFRNVQTPNPMEAEEHYIRFRQQQVERPDMFLMIDEVLPAHADTFIRAVRTVASQGLGLICSVE
ncbi:MAG TPA: hypothetical protein VKR06_32700 [Ktedonosporobacter sp.]|nr:hypothetical protein [Ktedonosporobacter sp.]